MRNGELIRTALQSLRSNRKRSFLTMIGIIIGIASVIAILALGKGVKVKILSSLQANQAGEQTALLTYKPDDNTDMEPGLNQDDVEMVRNAGFKDVRNVYIKQETEDTNIPVNVLGYDHPLRTTMQSSAPDVDVVAGHKWTSSDNQQGNQVAMISESQAKRFFNSTSDAVKGAVTINNASYTIVGVYKSNPDNIDVPELYVPKKTYFRGQSSQTGNTLAVVVAKGGNVSKVGKEVQSLLHQKGTHYDDGYYSFTDMAQMLEGISAVIDSLTYFIVLIGSISLVIAGIGVMNMMYISVSERTQEIGIRLAVGATSRQIMWQFLLEAVALTLTGGLIGFVLGAVLAIVISRFLPFTAIVTFGHFLLAFGVSTAVGIIFGLLPARQAANKNLIDILR